MASSDPDQPNSGSLLAGYEPHLYVPDNPYGYGPYDPTADNPPDVNRYYNFVANFGVPPPDHEVDTPPPADDHDNHNDTGDDNYDYPPDDDAPDDNSYDYSPAADAPDDDSYDYPPVADAPDDPPDDDNDGDDEYE
jgi:hypothetical protein